jgi:hypothetical protein
MLDALYVGMAWSTALKAVAAGSLVSTDSIVSGWTGFLFFDFSKE